MRLAQTIDHYEKEGTYPTTVLLLQSKHEVRAVIVALCLYSSLFADDPDDDTEETGHISSRMVGLIIDQIPDDPEPDEPWWSMLKDGSLEQAENAFRNAAELQEMLANLIDKAEAIVDGFSPESTPQFYTSVLNDNLLCLQQAIGDANSALAKLMEVTG